MNAEYQSHKQVWEMLKPRASARIAPSEALPRALTPAAPPWPESPGWYPASIDLVVIAHGLPELSSPLSEW